MRRTLLVLAVVGTFVPQASLCRDDRNTPVVGNPETVIRAYEQWRDALPDGDPILRMGLRWSKGLSSRSFPVYGTVEVNLDAGLVSVDIERAPSDLSLDAWLVQNHRGPGGTVRPEPDDRMILLGTLSPRGSRAVLTRQLDPDRLDDFSLDLVVVTPTGRRPETNGLLYAAPNLFDRLYAGQMRNQGRETLLRVAAAGSGTTLPEVVSGLVATGERLFFGLDLLPGQTAFNGNGRTCGTCHPAENNFTIDPSYIAGLAPDDPLFVAESGSSPLAFPNLSMKRFEIPELMRSDGLILLNADGFPELDPAVPDRFVMRAVPHLLGLSVTRQQNLDPLPSLTHALGWGGDGSPFPDGSLRMFAIGAIIQHFPKTLQRQEGACDDAMADFCLPDDEQLDALESFLLSLGRNAETTPAPAELTDEGAAAGRELFSGINACKNCHNLTVPNTKTGVESFLQNQLIASGGDLDGDGQPDPPRPPDGGFGRSPCIEVPTNQQFLFHCALLPDPSHCQDGPLNCSPCASDEDCAGWPCVDALPQASQSICAGQPSSVPWNSRPRCVFTDPDGPGPAVGQCFPELDGSFGDHSFNTPSIIESADTGPYFHNNVVDTLEGAIEFYGTPEFGKFSGGMTIDFDPGEVRQVSRFLRVMNSLDNIDNTVDLLIDRAMDSVDDPVTFAKLAKLSLANLQDTVKVLGGGSMHPDTVQDLKSAMADIGGAIFVLDRDDRLSKLASACGKVELGRNRMVGAADAKLLSCNPDGQR